MIERVAKEGSGIACNFNMKIIELFEILLACG